MIIFKSILCVLIFIIIPILLGLLITKFTDKKNNLFFAIVVGYIFEFASFELIYLPMYFLEFSFKALQWTWCILMLVLSIISVIINIKHSKKILVENINIIKKMPYITIVFMLLLILQVYMPVKFMQHVDHDDAFYLATTNTTIETNSLFKYNGYDGELYQEQELRYSMSGLVIYYAVLSEILNIHPAILEHTIWPAIIIPVEFIVYAFLGNELLNKNKEKLIYFLILLSTIYIFGFISIYVNFSFFAYRSWQGKALVANFIIPFVWFIYLWCVENDKKIGYWIVFLLTMFSSCFVTQMGVYLVPIEVGILSLISLIQERKILNFIKSISCCIPQIIVGIIYILFE